MCEMRNTFKLSVLAIICQVGAGVQRFGDSRCLRLHITTNDLDKSISEMLRHQPHFDIRQAAQEDFIVY
jgi:hypothetical protein